MDEKSKEVEKNFDAFQKLLPSILSTRAGKYALLRDAQIVEYFDSVGDAVNYARDNYNDGLYSVQRVTDQVENLGYFSYALA